MFMLLLGLLAVAFLVHVSRLERRTPQRVAEIGLLWLLAGYCGVPQLVVGAFSLAQPDQVAAILDFPAGNPFQDFMSVAYLGLALAATLSPLYRGIYLVGPAVGWATFWSGATWIHIRDFGGFDGIDPHAFLHVFGTHGLIAVLLLVGLVVSGMARPPGPAGP
jgi:hypothetical protein